MGRNSPLKVIILGAGPSGLCAAWNLVQDGHDVVVIEKEQFCGGQSITFQRGDYRYDLGPHNIHSEKKEIIRFFKKKIGEDFIKHKFSAQIYFHRKRINYPIAGMDIFRSISFLTIIGCALDFLWTRLVSFFMPRFKDDGSYESWIVNRFGRRLYNIYFSSYSKKVWKIEPTQLSDIVAKKRIAVSGFIELIHALIFKKQRYHPENPGLIDSYYFKEGIGSVSDFFSRGIIGGGGKIIKESTIDKIIVEQSSVRKIYYTSHGKMECMEFEHDDGKPGYKILSTIPINELIMLLEGDIPEDVVAAAKGLDFTSEVFLYLNIKKPNIFGIPLLYFSDPEFIFNRIYDIGMFSRNMVPDNKNAICLEITCNYNDQIWKATDDVLFDKCINQLEAHNLLKRIEVESFHTRRLMHAYPRFRMGYKNKLQAIFNYLNNIPDLISFGRQGLFTYANVDDAIWMGFEVAKHLAYQDRINLSLQELMPEYTDF